MTRTLPSGQGTADAMVNRCLTLSLTSKPPMEAPPGAFLDACKRMGMTTAEGRKAALASWTAMIIATQPSQQ